MQETPLSDPVQHLLSEAPLSLADWYGEPLACARAAEELSRIRELRRRTHQVGLRLVLAELLARYWSDGDADMIYRSLAATVRDEFERALLEFSYGQLLMARRCKRAWSHLLPGFSLAAHRLAPADYFRVLARHQLLAQLPLSDTPAEPAGLRTLLSEARIIQSLGGAESWAPASNGRQDTLG
ncbi:MAG TPA: hypothetical protein ENJ79_03620 [Gammaproteobacteria bacterium]|nr:hypothetical protein [Gammaproteobacteria bacterium]